MTVDAIVCPYCQQVIDANVSTCPHCGKTMESDASWPEWHGKPSGETGEPWFGKNEEVTSQEDESFEKLSLDPGLTNAPIQRPGKRAQVGLFLLSALIWFVAEIMFWQEDPASFWDFVWYGAAVVTIGLGIWLLVLLWQRSRTHGWGAAIRWLIS